MTAVYSYLHARRPGAVGVPDADGLGGKAGLDYDDSAVPGQIAATILHLPSVTTTQAGELTLAIRWHSASLMFCCATGIASRSRRWSSEVR